MTRTFEVKSPEPMAAQSARAPAAAPPPTGAERAGRKVQMFGAEAQLDLEEAAAVLDVSPSTFERLAIPCVQWSARGRRWRYGAIIGRARELEEKRDSWLG